MASEEESVKTAKSLFDYVEGYGNTSDAYSLVGVRFKKRILWADLPYKCFEEAHDHLLVSCKIFKDPNNLYHLKLKTPSVLSVFGGRVRHKQETILLLSMLGDALGVPEKILTHKFHNRVLYALVRGPIPKTFLKINRSKLFSVLLDTIRSCHFGRAGYRQCQNLRCLKRNRGCPTPATRFEVDFWHSFYPFVVELLRKKFVELVGSPPCSRLGDILFKAQRKCETLEKDPNLSGLLPSRDFYVCEITFESEVLLGIRYRTKEDVVEYVSPMIVAFTNHEYIDSCGQRTNCWIPLFRSITWWKRFGSNVFVGRLKNNLDDLKGILNWLSNRPSEKYRNILADLNVLKKIFLERS